VSRAVNEVVERCKDAVKEMYPAAAKSAAPGASEGADGVEGAGVGGETVRPTGGDATLWDSMQEMEKKREAPIVKAFEKLSLLG
jgi:elongator complex protein 1